MGGSLNIECSEGSTVIIGKDCMLSHSIRFFTTDMHSILDEKGNRINKSSNIVVGKHVWIGMGSWILKGSIIPDGCIIGASTTYSGKQSEENCIYAGNPAKKIK